ncbi:neutral zinc metallopeptidase [Massilia sp. PAMC28688]|uniref:KPN_02809 family neutral zinc metallopeptidase n=1 Tax=Massilia sp. PAMC28688 TaxID=2861283 RepID=UPI001C63628B|nr:neutral zinc metallopeptidase [Massilia sp. PAMC28688]QYF91899.1 neutral zinc metallopeptidase [Massilia sp. PAMC28688]
MKWEGNRESDNVVDHRGSGGRRGGFGIGGKSIGIGTIVLALIGSAVFGVNPMEILDAMGGGGAGGGAPGQQLPAQSAPGTDRQTRFVKTVLADTEDVWGKLFAQKGAVYQKPQLHVYTGAVSTACGTGQSAAGPFYCPADSDVYIDLSFYQLMQQKFGVTGEFAQAYVIAHEIGHHVQNQLGISGQVQAARGRTSEREANEMSVRLELQADCFAGVWAFHGNQARGILEQGDVESALKAAAAIGDDALQQQSRGRVIPDSFTHGTSAQRSRWFSKGLQTGDVEQCNTFDTRQL